MKRKNKITWWKVLIILTFIISINCLCLLLFDIETYETFEGKTLYLKNRILFIHMISMEGYGNELISYECDKTIEVNDLRSSCEGCSIWFQTYSEGYCGLILKNTKWRIKIS